MKDQFIFIVNELLTNDQAACFLSLVPHKKNSIFRHLRRLNPRVFYKNLTQNTRFV